MITCEQAAHICNKKQYKEASLKERFQLIMHVLICKTCASFSKKNTQLTKLCDKAKLHSLTPQEKEQIKKNLQGQS